MLITNFASGELSPNLNGRVDIQQYYQGAARIENFEIIPTGGIKRRPGTQRLGSLGGNNRLIPFIVNKDIVYVLELGENPNYDSTSTADSARRGIIYIWKIGLYTATKLVTPIYTDWNLDAIRNLQYAQNYDIMYFVHKDYQPYVLKMSAVDTFTGSKMQFNFMPDVELDDDFDYVMLVSSGSLPTKTNSNPVTFSYRTLIDGVDQPYSKTFQSGIKDYYAIKEGKLYKYGVNQWLTVGTDPKIETDLFQTSGKYPSCVAFFNNRLFFACSQQKQQMIWASAAPDSYATRYNDFTTYKKFVTVNRVTKDMDLHLFTADIAQADIDTTNHRATFRNVTQNLAAGGELKQTATDYFVSSDILPVGTKVVSVTESTITVNTDRVDVAFSETHTTETNVVMSIQLWRDANNISAEDYEYTVVANNMTTADCSFFFEIASDQNDAIKFLSTNRFLAVGTESSIWSVDPGVNALSINAIMQGRYGSDEIQGQAVETATVYFAQGKKGIREFYYDGQSEAFRTNNIALLADHLLRESAAVDFDYMTNPYSRLLIVRENGTVAEMLYDKTNGIMAWSRIIMEHCQIKSCAVTRGDDENDLVFFSVKDGTNYYLEMLDLGKTIYLDSFKVYEDAASLTGYNTGAVLFNQTTGQTCDYDNIPSGFINTGDVVYVGYSFKSYIKSMPVISGSPSKPVRITALLVRFLNSYKPVMKCTDMADEKFNSIRTVPYSGIAKVTYPGVTDHDVCFELETKEPEPVNILSVDAQTA